MTLPSDHKPISEEELKEMEKAAQLALRMGARGVPLDWLRLISEVRRLREALAVYAAPSSWDWQGGDTAEAWKDTFTPAAPDLREQDGWVLARKALGWESPDEHCPNPSCDGVKDDKTYGDTHRCFKDGRWLDDGSEM